jgi:hypothetical protein
MTHISWTAGDARGVAHAHVSGRTLCHAPAIGERYAWPMRARCADCSRAAEAVRPTTSGLLGLAGPSSRVPDRDTTPGPVRGDAPSEPE